MTWSTDIENILGKLMINCIQASKQHSNSYFYYKSIIKYFRLPTIVLSSVSSVSIALNGFLLQSHISLVVCGLGLAVSILNSIELFLKINDQIESENECAKDYYALAINIKKTLLLDREHRSCEGAMYLEKTYNSYMSLVSKSSLLKSKNLDKMLEFQNKLERVITSVPSSSDSSIESPLPDNDLERVL
jgi:hypothetical protein